MFRFSFLRPVSFRRTEFFLFVKVGIDFSSHLTAGFKLFQFFQLDKHTTPKPQKEEEEKEERGRIKMTGLS